MFKKILIANNGTEGTFKALAEALRLAHAHEFEAHMIYVEENLASGSQEGRRDENSRSQIRGAGGKGGRRGKASFRQAHEPPGLRPSGPCDCRLSQVTGRVRSACRRIERPFGAVPQDSRQDRRPPHRTRPLCGPGGEMILGQRLRCSPLRKSALAFRRRNLSPPLAVALDSPHPSSMRTQAALLERRERAPPPHQGEGWSSLRRSGTEQGQIWARRSLEAVSQKCLFCRQIRPNWPRV